MKKLKYFFFKYKRVIPLQNKKTIRSFLKALSFESFLLKYKGFLTLGLKSSILQNIRNFFRANSFLFFEFEKPFPKIFYS